MEINELNKKQLVLLTLLITFVVSIGTGIVTVSLMKQLPPTVPQTINNVIQRTIEKVTTIEQPKEKEQTKNTNNIFVSNKGNQLISIYRIPEDTVNKKESLENKKIEVGQGVILSDEGLILVNSNIMDVAGKYGVVLDNKMFSVYSLKKFDNGFSVLKIGISETKIEPEVSPKEDPKTESDEEIKIEI